MAIASVLGVQLLVVGALMLTAVPFALYYGGGDHAALLGSAAVTVAAGAGLYYARRRDIPDVTKREGYLIVVLGWLLMVGFSMLPYLLSGAIPSLTNAFFETMSGMTTTGATVLTDIEAVPRGILFWRSMTQWIGGMGIIVLTVALFPLLGIGGVELFGAEAPGPTSDKIHPRIQETAKRLYFLYVGLTLVATLTYMIGGMDFYDAVNHGLTTMATGGFSTKNASAAHWNDAPFIQYAMIFFMGAAGTNYVVLYYLSKRNWARAWRSDEFRAYLTIVAALTAVVTAVVYFVTPDGLELSFRESAFQIVSLVTTTGYVSADYTAWAEPVTMLCFILLFLGACAGSTSGGIKVIRHLVFFKNTYLEFKRLLYPRAVVPLKLDGAVVAPKVLMHILVFLLIFLMTFLIGSLVVTACGMDFLSAIGATATSLGNVGPAIGDVGPVDNFAAVPTPAKWVLSFLMLLGRLELFTIFILFTPYFWRDY